MEQQEQRMGKVVDNNDPNKLGRVKVQVWGYDDNRPLEDIAWAMPNKSGDGKSFTVPDIGKIVNVDYDGGDINKPLYSSSEHYNANLENKLKELSPSAYSSMNALVFDHKTQVYSNDSEGLILDHKMNRLNITSEGFDFLLKDNFQNVTIGDKSADEMAVLGSSFMLWLQQFLQLFLSGSALMTVFGLPVMPTAALIKSIAEFNERYLQDFLSHNVWISKNDSIETKERAADGIKGDDWSSSVEDNNLTTREEIDFIPTSGSQNSTFEQPAPNSNILNNAQQNEDKSSDIISKVKDATSNIENKVNNVIKESNENEINDLNILKRVLSDKKYQYYSDKNKMNIIAVRNNTINVNDRYTNMFTDTLYVIYNNGTEEIIKKYKYSTLPGTEFVLSEKYLQDRSLTKYTELTDKIGKTIKTKDFIVTWGNLVNDLDLKDGLKIMCPGQYIDTFYIGKMFNEDALLCRPGSKQYIWYDNKVDESDKFVPSNYSSPDEIYATNIDDCSLSIHLGYPGGMYVNNWSFGDHVFSNSSDLKQFFGLLDLHNKQYGNIFTYTLITKNDFDNTKSILTNEKNEKNKL